jgi:hypothetical protein
MIVQFPQCLLSITLHFSRQNYVVKNWQFTSQCHCPWIGRLLRAVNRVHPSQEELDEEEAELEAGKFEHVGWESMCGVNTWNLHVGSRNRVRSYGIWKLQTVGSVCWHPSGSGRQTQALPRPQGGHDGYTKWIAKTRPWPEKMCSC